MNWMYEGAKASVNREEYLLGKRVSLLLSCILCLDTFTYLICLD